MKKRGFGKNTHNLPRALPDMTTHSERPGCTEDFWGTPGSFYRPQAPALNQWEALSIGIPKNRFYQAKRWLKKRIWKKESGRESGKESGKNTQKVFERVFREYQLKLCVFFAGSHLPSPRLHTQGYSCMKKEERAVVPGQVLWRCRVADFSAKAHINNLFEGFLTAVRVYPL